MHTNLSAVGGLHIASNLHFANGQSSTKVRFPQIIQDIAAVWLAVVVEQSGRGGVGVFYHFCYYHYYYYYYYYHFVVIIIIFIVGHFVATAV